MFWQELTDSLRRSHPGALLVTGANTLRYYAAGGQPRTARRDGLGEGYYDVFNTAVGLDSAGRMQLHHKGKLVIGVENTPTIVFDILQFLVIDLGGVVGQIGMGQHGTAFEHRRAIARSANTGMSGFISARGDIGQTLGWEKRGVLTAAVPLNSQLTFYTRYGDYLGRISEYLMLLCVLYYIAYRAKKKNHLVK